MRNGPDANRRQIPTPSLPRHGAFHPRGRSGENGQRDRRFLEAERRAKSGPAAQSRCPYSGEESVSLGLGLQASALALKRDQGKGNVSRKTERRRILDVNGQQA